MSWLPSTNRPLVALFGASAAVLAAVDILAGRSPLVSVFVPALLVAAAVSLLALPQAWVRWSSMVLVAAFIATMAIQLVAWPYLFSDGTLRSVARYAIAGQLTARDSLPLRLSPGTQALSVHGRYRNPRGATAGLWTPSAPGLTVMASGSRTTGYATITTTTSGPRYVSRSYDARGDVAGRRFTVAVSVRCHASTSHCGDLALMARSTLPYEAMPGGTPLHAGPQWTRVTLHWNARWYMHGPVLHVLISGRWVGALDVKDLTVRAEGPHGAEALTPVNFLTFRGASRASARLPDIPLSQSPAWVPIDLTMPTGDIKTVTEMRLLAQAGAGTLGGPVATVRNLRVSALTESGKRLPVTPTLLDSLRNRGRAQGWFEDPNFAGHSLAVIGLMGLAATEPLWAVVTTALLSLIGVLSTGSRAAWMALLVGFSLYAWSRWRGRHRALLWALGLTATVVTGLYLLGGDHVRVASLGIAGEISRPKIWSVAIRAFATHPLTGIGASPRAFGEFWMANAGTAARIPISHAHDFWLALVAAYGITGAVVAVGLSLGLVLYVLRGSKRRHIPLLAAAFVMNTFDFTLLYGWVWIPLVVALASSDGCSSQPSHGSSSGFVSRPVTGRQGDRTGVGPTGPMRAAPSARSECER